MEPDVLKWNWGEIGTLTPLKSLCHIKDQLIPSLRTDRAPLPTSTNKHIHFVVVLLLDTRICDQRFRPWVSPTFILCSLCVCTRKHLDNIKFLNFNTTNTFVIYLKFSKYKVGSNDNFVIPVSYLKLHCSLTYSTRSYNTTP